MTEPEISIDWLGGNCPVQAEGTIDGKRFYFRARGERWSLEVGGDNPPFTDCDWSYVEQYGTWPDAGWMKEEEAEAFISKGATLYHGFMHAIYE